MTLDEAREHIGAAVVYRCAGMQHTEEGEITRISGGLVMVLYKGDSTAKATYAADLTLLTQTAPAAEQPDVIPALASLIRASIFGNSSITSDAEAVIARLGIGPDDPVSVDAIEAELRKALGNV